MADNELTAKQLEKRREKREQIDIISKPKLRSKGYQLVVKIAKGENFPKFGMSCDS